MHQPPTSQSTRKACKECRRLRLGCDREIPCYSCKRRGCPEICPNGTLPKGTTRIRSTLIVELQETIVELKRRNGILEEALRALQASVSTEPHPLLRECSPADSSASSEPIAEEEEILDALRHFSVQDDTGEILLHGPTVASQYLVAENPRLLSAFMPQGEPETLMSLPADLVLMSALFPFPPAPTPPVEKLDDFVPLLPSYDAVLFLTDLYFTNFAWCTAPIPRALFMTTVIKPCYPDGKPAASLRHMCPHAVSILFMVCAVGILADLNDEKRTVHAEEFHTLARAALCIFPVYDLPSIPAVQSMVIMLFYHMHTARSLSYTLALWSVIGRMCESLRLNYDQRKANLDSAEMREWVFWEAMTLDTWQAFLMGRAKAFSFRVITCSRPKDPEPIPGGGWWTWKHNFTVRLDNVLERAFRQKGTTYSQICLLESELRSATPPAILQWPADDEERAAVLGSREGSTNAMQRAIVKISGESSVLHLHRWFFLQAIRERPDDPFEHPFGRSVHVVLEISNRIIAAIKDIYTYQRAITVIFRALWIHVYSAAMELAEFAVTCPQMHETEAVLASLDSVCGLFVATQPYNVQTREALYVLFNLQEEAHNAFTQHRTASTAQVETVGFWTGVDASPHS